MAACAKPSVRPITSWRAFTLIELLVVIAIIAILATTNTSAVQYTELFNFNGVNGACPSGGLVLSENVLYGTTLVGSTNGNCFGTADGVGTIFRINTDGTGFTNLYSFSANCGSPNESNGDGAYPAGRLLLSGNVLYGTSYYGGTNGAGTIFAINTDGTGFTNLYNFPYTITDGGWWNSGACGALILSSNTLYGTTAYCDASANGSVFSINTNGTGFTNLYTFSPHGDPYSETNSDGKNPSGGLVLLTNSLFGTTCYGGSNGCGVIFKIDTSGSNFAVLHTFSSTNGAHPVGRLTLSGNTLYGATTFGGDYGFGTIFKINTDGTGFTNLFSFQTDVGGPLGGLVLSGNTLYGASGGGVVFAINTNGIDFTLIYSLGTLLTPVSTESDLTLSGQTLYGATYDGGSNDVGTVFAIGPSRPAITNIALNANQSVTLSCLGDAGFKYLMLSSTNLLNWKTNSTNSPAPDGTWQVTDYSPTNVNQPACFYRAAVEP